MAARRWIQLGVATAVVAGIAGAAIGRFADHRAGPPATPSAIPANALSLADAAGSDVLAVTITPPTPGLVRLKVKIVGVDAIGARNVVVTAASKHGVSFQAALSACGDGCFDGTANIRTAGTWTFTVRATTSREPLTVRVTTPIPAPDAQATLAKAVARMGGLRSLRVDETLTARVGGPILRTEFRFLAPNRFTYTETGAAQASAIIIAHRRYDRDSPASPWVADDWPAPDGFVWPRGFYTAFWTPATAVRMLGPATLRGAPAHIVAFAATNTDAWFRLWIGDRDGLVHRMEMRARNHTMNQDYADFNRPITIVAPTP